MCFSPSLCQSLSRKYPISSCQTKVQRTGKFQYIQTNDLPVVEYWVIARSIVDFHICISYLFSKYAQNFLSVPSWEV